MEKIRLLSLPFLVSFFILFYLIPFYFLPFFLYLQQLISAAKNSRVNIYHLTLHVNMNTTYLCGVCSKIVAKNHNAVCCDKYDMLVHIVCNNLTKYCYRKLQKDNSPWFCVVCLQKEMPFSNLSDKQLKIFMSGKTIISPNLVKENQNHQLVPQEYDAAIENNLYVPQQIQ